MRILKLEILVLLVVAWVAGTSQLVAQSTGLSALTEETDSSQSGDDKRGRIDPAESEPGLIGPNVENVREVIQDFQGLQRQRQNFDMRVENLNERRNSRRRRGRQNPPPPVHVQFQPKFEFHRFTAAQVAAGVQMRVNRLLENRSAGSVSVFVDARTAVLSGTVRSEHARRLLEKLVEIEPGISRVENRIAVDTPQ